MYRQASIGFFLSASILAAAFFLSSGKDVLSKPAAKASAPKQCVYSRSARESNSSTLGIVGVPAYVVFPNGGQQCGVYVTRTIPGGLWKSMGLRPGRVLLTIEGRSIQSPSSADSVLSGRSGQIKYTYAKVVDGAAQLVQSQMPYYGPPAALGMATGAGLSISEPAASAAKVDDSTSISQLESHMVDLVNKDRAKHGRASLSDNSRLSDLARNYAEYLLKTGTFSHTADGRDPMQRAKAAGIGGGLSENLAFQTRGIKTDTKCVDDAENLFMSEPPDVGPPHPNHRWNILWSDARSIGIGMARNKTTLMMVQEISDGNP